MGDLPPRPAHQRGHGPTHPVRRRFRRFRRRRRASDGGVYWLHGRSGGGENVVTDDGGCGARAGDRRQVDTQLVGEPAGARAGSTAGDASFDVDPQDAPADAASLQPVDIEVGDLRQVADEGRHDVGLDMAGCGRCSGVAERRAGRWNGHDGDHRGFRRRRSGRNGRSAHRRGAGNGPAKGAQLGEEGAHGHLLPYGDDQAVDHTRVEDLDLDFRLLGVDERDDVSGVDLVTRADSPVENRAHLHVRPERWHQERQPLSHVP